MKNKKIYVFDFEDDGIDIAMEKLQKLEDWETQTILFYGY